MKAVRKIVIKVGTSTLTEGTKKISRRSILGLVQQMTLLQSLGWQLILVSSGAVATGRELLNASSPSKQAFASIGQIKLMQVWSEIFALFDLQVGQVLVTKEDFSSSKESFTKETLDCLLQHGIIPIINENDTVAAQERRIGDNDNLAALVAKLISANIVILLTDQEGLYTEDPRKNSNAKLISIVEQIDDAIFSLAKGSSSSLGTGGMTTKIQAAQAASQAGIRTVIASSSRPNVLIDLAKGKQIGTLFLEGKTR